MQKIEPVKQTSRVDEIGNEINEYRKIKDDLLAINSVVYEESKTITLEK